MLSDLSLNLEMWPEACFPFAGREGAAAAQVSPYSREQRGAREGRCGPHPVRSGAGLWEEWCVPRKGKHMHTVGVSTVPVVVSQCLLLCHNDWYYVAGTKPSVTVIQHQSLHRCSGQASMQRITSAFLAASGPPWYGHSLVCPCFIVPLLMQQAQNKRNHSCMELNCDFVTL